jgi:hypothetical protein
MVVNEIGDQADKRNEAARDDCPDGADDGRHWDERQEPRIRREVA